jgi:hypothetical protein
MKQMPAVARISNPCQCTPAGQAVAMTIKAIDADQRDKTEDNRDDPGLDGVQLVPGPLRDVVGEHGLDPAGEHTQDRSGDAAFVAE